MARKVTGKPAGRPAGAQSSPPIEALDAWAARYRCELTGEIELGAADLLRMWVGVEVPDRPDRGDVFTGSTDAHGHTARVTVAMPPWLVGEVDTMVARANSPYRTRAEFVRDACTHRMWDLAEGLVMPGEREKAAYNMEMMVAVMEDWKAWVEAGKAAVARVKDVLVASQDAPRFDVVIARMKEYALGIDPEFRQEALEVIEGFMGEE